MKILVTAKRVTDPEAKLKLNFDASWIATDGVKFVLNPFDEIAIEEGLKLKEKYGGEVTIFSLGSKQSAEQIRMAMAMGADRGILVVTDEICDAYSVAKVLAKVIEMEKPDIVLMGKQAVDDDMNQVGQMVSTITGLPHATFASKLELLDNNAKARVTREVDGGLEVKEVQMPAIVTTDLRLNTPRYASLPGIMKAKNKPLKETTPHELGVPIKPKVKVVKLTEPPKRKGGVIVENVGELVLKLKNEAKVL